MAKQIPPEFLYRRFLQGECTQEELAALFRYFGTANEDALRRLIENELSASEDVAATAEEGRKLATLKELIDARIQSPDNGRFYRLWPRIAAAASVLLVIGAGMYFLTRKPELPVALAGNDIKPFTNQAILKTGHGKTLLLDSNAKGTLAQYANTQIQKTAGDRIAYTNNVVEDKVVFDTLQVPAGGKPYHLKLADGSQVIVNVASALRFPENFRKNNNEVELIAGEAYFNIVHNAASPLTIKAKGQVIEDIGTEFNVNIYNEEPDSRTTLVEGKIRVNKKDLVPGEQAILNANNLTIAKADIGTTIGWIKGDFVFNGEKIQQVMRELARWYNIEVKYEGKPTDVGFYLKIARSKNISEVLNALERTKNVHFKIEGRRVTVLSKK